MKRAPLATDDTPQQGKVAREKSPSKRGRTDSLYGVISIVGCLIAWQLAVSANFISEFFLPGPKLVFNLLVEMIADGSLFMHIGVSLARVVAGFLLAVAVAIPLGMMIGLWRPMFHLVDPWIELIRPIPPIAWIPMAILWLGLDEESKVAIIMYGAFFPIFLNTVSGLRGVDRVHVWAALTLGVSPRQIFWHVILRSALPRVVVGLRLGAGMAFIVLVAAELILAEFGLGFLIQDGRNQLRTEQIMVGIVTIGVLGYLINKILLWLESKWIPYRETVEEDG
jgi:ABC-type nitrate/sulfonate/bicarbonate transport system permease component